MLMKLMREQLIDLLNIYGVSGMEAPVREHLIPVLTPLVDMVKVDHYGNLLAEKKMGNGKGATVLLSAHMDTVSGVMRDKVLVEVDGMINAELPSGKPAILGADDRAGIAIVLTVLRNLKQLEGFNGTVKVAFSREEEVGCVGSEKIDPRFYEDADLAIVVDRRGNRDIVVGCGMAFCSDSVGEFMENVSGLIEQDWACVGGGISDAMTFAQNGVNSINLSAGYMNEHTDREFVSLSDMGDTVRLIMQTFAIINLHCEKFNEVPNENKWVKAWYPKDRHNDFGYSSSAYNYASDWAEEEIWAEVNDENGDVWAYEVGDHAVIQQGDNEVVLSRESLRDLMFQLRRI